MCGAALHPVPARPLGFDLHGPEARHFVLRRLGQAEQRRIATPAIGDKLPEHDLAGVVTSIASAGLETG